MCNLVHYALIRIDHVNRNECASPQNDIYTITGHPLYLWLNENHHKSDYCLNPHEIKRCDQYLRVHQLSATDSN